MSIEEHINDLIARMYDCNGGWEFESDDEVGIRFISLQDNLSHMTFDNWDQVESYINTLD